MQKQVNPKHAAIRKYPEQIVIAIVKDPQDKYNPITLGWAMPTSHDPMMMAISVGKTRYSLEAIRRTGEFVISFPSVHQADETMLFGTQSGRQTDKLARAGSRTEPATQIDCVMLTDAVANFECQVAGELETGDHVVFAGRIVTAHENEDPSLGRLYTVGQGHKLGGIAPI